MMNREVYIECYPDKAQYLQGETVNILLLYYDVENAAEIVLTITELERTILEKHFDRDHIAAQKTMFPLEPDLPVGNYGVDVCLRYPDTEQLLHTAFDIVDSYTSNIRYGFLTDFTLKDLQDCTDIDYAVKLHLNVLQFYDWMFRHDQLVSDTDEYREPLGREISLRTIRNKIKACKEKGIRPFAYGAVYAASKEAFARHPEWAFYKKNGEALTFADWLVFMDTSENAPWLNHIIGEYQKAVSELGFQGIQMDTYGFPKYARNHKQERISLAHTFPNMIQKTLAAVKAVDEKAGVIFNAVSNWPTEYIAKSGQDAIYIEVWPPYITYYHLYSLIREAKLLGAENVILAAYIEAFRETKTMKDIQAAETSFLLTNAVIQASGGTQIILGETNGILQDSYFVNYAVLREEFLPAVKAYCDFQVRYGKLLYDNRAMDISMTSVNGINKDIQLSVKDCEGIHFSSCAEPGKVWSLIRESTQLLMLQLINLYDINDLWNQPKYLRPKLIQNIQADILLDTEVKAVYYTTPDDGSCTCVRLSYESVQMENGQHILFQIPKLDIWDLIWIEFR